MIEARVANKFIDFREELAEGFIWIDYCKLRAFPTQFSSTDMPVPYSFGDKKVVILNFTIKIVRWNIENSISSIKVKMNSIALGNSCLP